MALGHCIVPKIDFKIDSHLSLCTDVPPPSQKIGRRDVRESLSLIVFRYTLA